MENKCFLIVDGSYAGRSYAETVEKAIEEYVKTKRHIEFTENSTVDYLKCVDKKIKKLFDIRCYELKVDEQHRIPLEYFKSIVNKFNDVCKKVTEKEEKRFSEELVYKQKTIDNKKREEEIKLLKELQKKYPDIKVNEQ